MRPYRETQTQSAHIGVSLVWLLHWTSGEECKNVTEMRRKISACCGKLLLTYQIRICIYAFQLRQLRSVQLQCDTHSTSIFHGTGSRNLLLFYMFCRAISIAESNIDADRNIKITNAINELTRENWFHRARSYRMRECIAPKLDSIHNCSYASQWKYEKLNDEEMSKAIKVGCHRARRLNVTMTTIQLDLNDR